MAFNGLWTGWLLYNIMHAVAFWLLFAISFPVHRSEYGWTEGCQSLQAEETDFGK